jgi:hypothetical protein
LDQLEDYIKDYIIQDSSDDPILNHYILLARTEEKTGISCFSGGLLDRPALWERFVRPWILEGIQEKRKLIELSKPPV